MQEEIQLLQRLRHINVVRYLNVVRTSDHLNLVTECRPLDWLSAPLLLPVNVSHPDILFAGQFRACIVCDGGCLADLVKRFGPLPEKLCAVYIRQTLRGLVYLHSRNVIHRDIKGANILLTKAGQVKLAGTSAAVDSGLAGDHLIMWTGLPPMVGHERRRLWHCHRGWPAEGPRHEHHRARHALLEYALLLTRSGGQSSTLTFVGLQRRLNLCSGAGGDPDGGRAHNQGRHLVAGLYRGGASDGASTQLPVQPDGACSAECDEG